MGFGEITVHYETADSTNEEAKKYVNEDNAHGMLIYADSQRNGRGRRGKRWISDPGDGICMSYIIKPDMHPAEASMLTLVISLAVRESVDALTEIDAMIKWPNDIVINGKKTAGILTEMQTDGEKINYVIAGIGINVNMEKVPAEVADTATSLFIESGLKFTNKDVSELIGKYMDIYYDIFCRTKDMSLLKNLYEKNLVNMNRKVYITERENTMEYTAIGINDRGELLVKEDDGIIKTIRAGEVSVRGIYGYT